MVTDGASYGAVLCLCQVALAVYRDCISNCVCVILATVLHTKRERVVMAEEDSVDEEQCRSQSAVSAPLQALCVKPAGRITQA